MKKQILGKLGVSSAVVAGLVGVAALLFWKMMAGRKQSRPKYSAPRLEDCGRGEDSLDRGSGDSDDELEMRPQGGEETNEWDEIEMSRKDSSKEEDGGEKAVAKKRNVEGFL